MNIINTDKLHIKSWCNDLEDSALQQAKNIASLPFACHHIALMSDCHMGYGAPIGGVIATKNTIIPNFVGVDIGCGMRACKTLIKADEVSIDIIKKILGDIRQAIPVGMRHNKEPVDLSELGKDLSIIEGYNSIGIINREYKSACLQAGTLGGGNHFIELQKDQNGFLWIMLHSGSRNLGFKVANHYNQEAMAHNIAWFSSVPINHELAFLPFHSEIGQEYFKAMSYCLAFAKLNRELMTGKILDAMSKHINSMDYDFQIDIHHNYAALENHYGQNVIVHRKGAVRAREGEVGIIAGSMGTNSYIIQGKGNPESFCTCSHGAGRRMSRKKAINELPLGEEMMALDKKGIIHGMRNKSDLDEAPGAYKDIESVMEQQKDLVSIMYTLTPIASIKG